MRREKEAAVTAQEFEKAASLRDEERRLSEDLERMRREWLAARNSLQPVVTGDDIADVVAEWTGIPVFQITEEESERRLSAGSLNCPVIKERWRFSHSRLLI